MVSYLQIENLTKSYGDRLLFADVTFGVYEGDKIGLIAQNGKGKSTLLSIIAGEEDYDSGRVVFRNGLKVGYLRQTPVFPDGATVLEAATPETTSSDDDWNMEDRVRSLLGTFGIHDTSRPVATLSGGQQKRVALARTLLSEPQMLILDEPTNHLDIDMIEWLENYLSRQRVTLLLVTHDRWFLDRVCDKIIELDRQQIFTYQGDYNYYLQKRQERMENLSRELDKVRNLLRTEQEWMRRQPQARGSKAKYRIDNFHQLKERSRIDLTERNVELTTGAGYIGSKIFEAVDVSKSFGDIRILDKWSYTFARYEKVGIVGPNGAGKSTFIKLLLGEIKPDSGHFDIGQTVRWGYYSQEGMTVLDPSKKVIDAVTDIAEEIRIDDKTRLSARQFLNKFLFTSEDQQKYIASLSGGEKRRLYLATVLMRNPNFLILDEPTNDLDIMTLTILEDYLVNFKGCVIVVSHDRFFLDRIVDHLFVFKGNGVVTDFPGDYSTYRHCVRAERQEAARNAAAQDTSKDAAKQHTTAPRKQKLTFKERRELEQLEAELPELEKRRDELEQSLSGDVSDHEVLARMGEELMAVREKIDEVEMRLLELMEKE